MWPFVEIVKKDTDPNSTKDIVREATSRERTIPPEFSGGAAAATEEKTIALLSREV